MIQQYALNLIKNLYKYASKILYNITKEEEYSFYSIIDNNNKLIDITNFKINNTIRVFEAILSITLIDEKYENEEMIKLQTRVAIYHLIGFYKNNMWQLKQTSDGDLLGVVFFINNDGQIQFTYISEIEHSPSIKITYRLTTLSV